MTNQPLLEIQVHLMNGRTEKFVQNDPHLVRRFLEQIDAKVFTQPNLILFDTEVATVYRTAALIGISVLMEHAADRLSHLFPLIPGSDVRLQEITEYELEVKRKKPCGIVVDQPFRGLGQMEFTTGQRVWFECFIPKAATKPQERWILQNVFARPALTCRPGGNGVNIWNQAHVVSHKLFPAPEAPAGAWAATLQVDGIVQEDAIAPDRIHPHRPAPLHGSGFTDPLHRDYATFAP